MWKNSTVSTPRYSSVGHDRREPAFGLPLQACVVVRRDRARENAVAMHVLRERIERALAARALHADQRHLAVELRRTPRRSTARCRARATRRRAPPASRRRAGRGRRSPCGASSRSPASRASRPPPASLCRVDRHELRGRNAERAKQRLLGEPVLRRGDRGRRREHLDAAVAAISSAATATFSISSVTTSTALCELGERRRDRRARPARASRLARPERRALVSSSVQSMPSG